MAIAFRWGVAKGSLIYNDFMNLEPSGPQQDDDIDINDLQFVFGRFGSTCGDPHPPQLPVNPSFGTPTPTPTDTPTDTPSNTPTHTPTDTPSNTLTPTSTNTPTLTPTPMVPPKILGDVNLNGVVNSIDAALVLLLITDLIDSLNNESNADTNVDSSITSEDALLILQVVVGFLPSLPPTGPTPTPLPPLPVTPEISITSASGLVSSVVDVDVEGDFVGIGLGAWTIEVVYDTSIVAAADCLAQQGGACNEAFADNSVRFAGVSTTGLAGSFSLANISFTCLATGSTALTLAIQNVSSSAVGFPQPIAAATQNGSITCS